MTEPGDLRAREKDHPLQPVAGPAWALAILLILGLAALNLLQWLRSGPRPSSAPSPPAAAAGQAGPRIQTMVLAYAPVQKRIVLNGQISPTERGRADVTAPLSGAIVEPLVKVGQHVSAGAPIAVINSAFGQTSLQLLQKLEGDQNTVLTASNSYQQAIATLGQARSTLAAAETALSQAVDNLAQARAEMANADHDYRRKRLLFTGGVYARSDVDDARERWLKAKSVLMDTAQCVTLARRGVVIARKNVIPAEDNVRLTKGSVTLAQANLERDRAIYSQSSVSGATLPRSLTPLDVTARSRYSRGASADSAMFYVRAPISGVVISVNMSAGLAVSPTTVLASIADVHEVYADASAYESQLSMLEPGDRIQVRCEAYPGRTFDGTVSFVGKTVDPGTRTCTVRCRIHNPRQILRVGMFVTAVVAADHPRQALMVPQEAVLFDGERYYVTVLTSDGRYEKRTVHQGIQVDGKVELLDGARAGERVVTGGNLLVVPE